eukprot:scaffold125349_cov22-Prasinocladus_malaysianus.AAC.1
MGVWDDRTLIIVIAVALGGPYSQTRRKAAAVPELFDTHVRRARDRRVLALLLRCIMAVHTSHPYG